MIAATIGRTFLKVFNEKAEKNYSAKEFFEKEYFECFYNHPKYMQWINNSEFDQISKRKLHHREEERKNALQKFHSKIGERRIFDMSTVIGFPASDNKGFAVTSGQVTDIEIEVDENEAYLSWIGSGLSIGTGKHSILFENEDILFDTYQGWKVYRNLLNDKTLDKLKGNQINSWNGLWLSYFYSKRFRENFDVSTLTNVDFFTEKPIGIELNKIKWSELLFNISRKFPNSTFVGYVHAVGDTNQTVGFIPFQFEKASSIIKYYKKLFGENAYLNDSQKYERLFGKNSLSKACEHGSIGLQALEPKDLRKYMGNDANLKLVKPKQDKDEEKNRKALQKDYENIITYRTYKTWLTAMITKNKEENLNYSMEIAEILYEYKVSARVEKKLIDEGLLKAKSKKYFMSELANLIGVIPKEQTQKIKDFRDKVYLMNEEEFGYLLVLIKFDYAFVERERS